MLWESRQKGGGRTERGTEMHLQTERHAGRRQSDKESLLTDRLCAYIAPLRTFTFQKEDQGLRTGVT